MKLTERTSLREYYIQEFPEDRLGTSIDPSATFLGLFDALDNYEDVYDYIGVDDSLVRERLFVGLAQVMDVNYEYVYDQWLMGARTRNESKQQETLESYKDDREVEEYERLVQELEDEGLSRSDAQAAVDAEMMKGESTMSEIPAERFINDVVRRLEKFSDKDIRMIKDFVSSKVESKILKSEEIRPALKAIKNSDRNQQKYLSDILEEIVHFAAIFRILPLVRLYKVSVEKLTAEEIIMIVGLAARTVSEVIINTAKAIEDWSWQDEEEDENAFVLADEYDYNEYLDENRMQDTIEQLSDGKRKFVSSKVYNESRLTEEEQQFFDELMDFYEFEVYTNEDGKLMVNDLQGGACLGDICDEEFNDEFEILDRMDVYHQDYIIAPLEEEYDVDFGTYEEWFDFLKNQDEYNLFKKEEFVLNLLSMLLDRRLYA